MDERSKQVRRDTIALSSANGGYHYGGCFSVTEILIALFDHVLSAPWDRFVLSKGHACWPMYVLLREKGLDPKLDGHPSRDPTNGIYATTGSLGHGLPLGIGAALAKRVRGDPGRVFVVLGDGECQEGTTWESLLIAAHHSLGNLVAVVDWHGIQGSDHVANTLKLPRFREIAEAVGWSAVSCDGHRVPVLVEALSRKPSFGKPRLIIAHTVKGKGVSFMEGRPEWHARGLDPEQKAQALEELR